MVALMQGAGVTETEIVPENCKRDEASGADLASVLAPPLVDLPEGALPDEPDHVVILYPHLPPASRNQPLVTIGAQGINLMNGQTNGGFDQISSQSITHAAIKSNRKPNSTGRRGVAFHSGRETTTSQECK